MIDDDHPLAEAGDVGHVVGGQQDRHAGLAVQFAQEVAHALLGDDIEADRRLVQVEDRRLVEERRRQVAAHPLAERELAHRLIEEGGEVEQLGETAQIRRVAVGRHAIDVAEQFEAVDQRQVPPELRALAEDDADPRREALALLPRHQPGDRRAPAAGDEDAGEHLDRGALARAVRPDIADHLPRFDPKGDLVHRRDLAAGPGDQPAQRAEAPGVALLHAETLLQLLDLDQRHGCSSSQ